MPALNVYFIFYLKIYFLKWSFSMLFCTLLETFN